MDRSRATRLAAGSLAISAAATGIAVALSQWRRTPTASATGRAAPGARGWLRTFVAHRFNPIVIRLGLVGGRRSPWSFLEHVGRSSGTVYRTPVLPKVAGGYVYVPLPYGEDVHWARNVRSAGHCRLQRQGSVLDLDEPAVIAAAEQPGIPAWYRSYLERRRARTLRLHVLVARLGALADPQAASPDVAAPGATVVPAGSGA
jgi:hypothetical protein